MNLVRSCQHIYQRMDEYALQIFSLRGTHFICRYWHGKCKSPAFSRHLVHDTGIGLDKPIHPILSMTIGSFGRYTLILRFDAILLGNVTIVGPDYMVSHLSEGKKYHSGRSNLPTCGQNSTISVQSLLLHIIIAQIWYETVRWRKVSRIFCSAWRFVGYRNASWRSALELQRRKSRIPKWVVNDNDMQLLHEKCIKMRLFVFLID